MKTPAFLILVSLLILTSCDKEEIVTDCDRLTSKVKDIAKDFSTVDLYQENIGWILDAPYVIEGNFIRVYGTFYNLCMVKKISNDLNSITIYF